ncbi:MAG TPA: methyltransferase domain-containing protein [Thermoanaerobaculia bacterium]|jgi:predicted SAM-dependent methyltransferase|nr:methyltransferase domain-containing protein [Thermoanaerobaculia bacterium]
MRLHIGSGPVAIEGWTNVDVTAYPGVDVVLDVREPWPFTNVELIFAEHFLEHLTLVEGLRFLRECRRVLRDDGVLRLSTPNLDWVWLTHYKPPTELTLEEQLIGCLEINRAFHGWGHQFLYNFRTLEHALRAAGFAEVTQQEYGASNNDALCGLERHERHGDLPDAPAVVVIEARGIADAAREFENRIAPSLRDYEAK